MANFIKIDDGEVLNIDSISYIRYRPEYYGEPYYLNNSVLTIYIDNSSLTSLSFSQKEEDKINDIIDQLVRYAERAHNHGHISTGIYNINHIREEYYKEKQQ